MLDTTMQKIFITITTKKVTFLNTIQEVFRRKYTLHVKIKKFSGSAVN